MLSDIAGLPVRHVPKCLSELFCDIMGTGGKIFALVTGDPVPCFPPWPPNEEGGGIVLPCNYICTYIITELCYNKLKECLERVYESKSMELVNKY